MFDYHLASPRKGEYPFTPFVHIVLDGYVRDRDGGQNLSAQLMTDEEIDYCVQQLKSELDDVGRRAKKARRSAFDKHLQDLKDGRSP